jgi:predicted NBD/HSP70 family sugar kinase
MTAARVGLGGVILERREISRPRGERPAVKVVAPLAEFVREAEGRVPADAVCVGVGRRGARDVPFGGWASCASATIRIWLHEPLGEARPGGAWPTPAANSRRSPSATVADLAALAEHTRGVAVGCDNVVLPAR